MPLKEWRMLQISEQCSEFLRTAKPETMAAYWGGNSPPINGKPIWSKRDGYAQW